MFAKLILLGFCRVVFSTRQKLFLPGRFFPWKKPVFSTNRQKLANPVHSTQIRNEPFGSGKVKLIDGIKRTMYLTGALTF
jgi:hypothetical protein